jgi:transcriptional regulator of met regulon
VHHFTESELRELLRDPALHVTIGQPLSEDGIAALLAGDGDETPAAKKGGRAKS